MTDVCRASQQPLEHQRADGDLPAARACGLVVRNARPNRAGHPARKAACPGAPRLERAAAGDDASAEPGALVDISARLENPPDHPERPRRVVRVDGDHLVGNAREWPSTARLTLSSDRRHRPGGATAVTDERSAALRREGYQAIYDLDYDRADGLFRQAIAADPGDYAAYRGAAAANWQRALFIRGTLLVDDYAGHTRSTKLVPMPPPPPALAAAFHRDLGRAVALAEKAVAEHYNDAAPHAGLGAALGLYVWFGSTIEPKTWDPGRKARRAFYESQLAHTLDPARTDVGLVLGTCRYAMGCPARFDSSRASSASRAAGRRASGCWKRLQPVRATSRRSRSFAWFSSTRARNATRRRPRSSATWNEPIPAIVCFCWRRARSSVIGGRRHEARLNEASPGRRGVMMMRARHWKQGVARHTGNLDEGGSAGARPTASATGCSRLRIEFASWRTCGNRTMAKRYRTPRDRVRPATAGRREACGSNATVRAAGRASVFYLTAESGSIIVGIVIFVMLVSRPRRRGGLRSPPGRRAVDVDLLGPEEFSCWRQGRPAGAHRAAGLQDGGSSCTSLIKGDTGSVSTLHVRVWSPRYGTFVKLDLPFWMMRLTGNRPITLNAGSLRQVTLTVTPEEIDRRGPGLVLNWSGRKGERLLVWTE
jgi:hypothetical protein